MLNGPRSSRAGLIQLAPEPAGPRIGHPGPQRESSLKRHHARDPRGLARRSALVVGAALLVLAHASASRAATVTHATTSKPGTITATLCRLGEAGAPVDAQDLIDFSTGDDAYYTYLSLDSLTCSTCGANTYAYITHAHLALYFPAAPETVSVAVDIVGSVPVACHYPDYMDPQGIICGSFTAQFDCQDSLSTLDIDIPFPPGCTLRQVPRGPGVAFLGITFLHTTHPAAGQKPQLATWA